MTDILKTLSAMTPQWLHSALGDAGWSPPGITSVQVRPMDGFTGAMGEVGIVTVAYDRPTDLPSEFVAKCPLDNELSRLYASVMLSYQREAGFYRDMAQPVSTRSGITLARCYVNLFDPETHDANLLIEHIHPAEKGDILTGTTFERMHELVGLLARMHGAFWMDESLSAHDWILGWDAPSLIMGIPFTVDSWNARHTRFAGFYPADLAELIDTTWIADIEGWLERFAARHWTFIHMDYELDNVLFRHDGPVVVDWQSGMFSWPGHDLGWLLFCSHNDETLAREPELLQHYLQEFRAAGGPDWSLDDLTEDLAWSAFYACGTNHVPYNHSLDAGDERATRRFETMLRGAIAAAGRWGTVERLGDVA